jgi:hypothetical protein
MYAQLPLQSYQIYFINRSVCPKVWDASIRDVSTKEGIVQGTLHPRDTASKGHCIQGTNHPRDALFKGWNIRDFSYGDPPVGDEITLHCTVYLPSSLPFLQLATVHMFHDNTSIYSFPRQFSSMELITTKG